MNDTVMQIRISNKLKKQSMTVSEKLGFTASTLIKLFLQHVVATRKIPFEIQEIPNAKTAKILLKAEKEILTGNTHNSYRFDNMDEAIKFMKQYVKTKRKNRNHTKKSISPKTSISLSNYSQAGVQATQSFQTRSL